MLKRLSRVAQAGIDKGLQAPILLVIFQPSTYLALQVIHLVDQFRNQQFLESNSNPEICDVPDLTFLPQVTHTPKYFASRRNTAPVVSVAAVRLNANHVQPSGLEKVHLRTFSSGAPPAFAATRLKTES